MLWTLLGIFAGGIALNLTPCIYPLIPITVSYFGGQGSQDQRKLVIHGACYIGGLVITNSVLGVIAALTGGMLGSLLQHPLVLALVAAVLILFASSLFGFWEIRLPYSLSRIASKTYSGYFGSLFMGMTLGVVASACIGPFILGLLTWVAASALHGAGARGLADLGRHHWKHKDRVFNLLYPEPRPGSAAFFPGPVFRAAEQTSPFR